MVLRRLRVIGIGPGGPDHLTYEAAAAIGSLDAVVILDKGDDLADLAILRQELLQRHARADLRTLVIPDPPRILPGPKDPGYAAAVDRWHAQRVELLASGLEAALADGGAVGVLVWGDPSLYDSTLRLVDRLVEVLPFAIEVDVVAGVSSLHLLTAAHRITLNRVGAAVRITTGRRLADAPPDEACDVVVFLDGSCAFTQLDPRGIDIFWGAYLGSPDQLLIAGTLADRSDEIVEQRAKARDRKGWMFDTYLLRWRG